MLHVIAKDIKGNKYYANFPNAPQHFRYPKWEGLMNNATGFRVQSKAEIVMMDIEPDSLEPLSIVKCSPDPHYP